LKASDTFLIFRRKTTVYFFFEKIVKTTVPQSTKQNASKIKRRFFFLYIFLVSNFLLFCDFFIGKKNYSYPYLKSKKKNPSNKAPFFVFLVSFQSPILHKKTGVLFCGLM